MAPPTLYMLKMSNEKMNESTCTVKESFEYHYGKRGGCYNPCAKRTRPRRRCNCVCQTSNNHHFFEKLASFLDDLKGFSLDEIQHLVKEWKPCGGSGPQSYQYQVPFIEEPMLVCPLTLTNMLPIAIQQRRSIMRILSSSDHMVHLMKTTNFGMPMPACKVQDEKERPKTNIRQGSGEAPKDASTAPTGKKSQPQSNLQQLIDIMRESDEDSDDDKDEVLI